MKATAILASLLLLAPCLAAPEEPRAQSEDGIEPDELDKFSVEELYELFKGGSATHFPQGMVRGRVIKNLPDIEAYYERKEGEGQMARLERRMKEEGEDGPLVSAIRERFANMTVSKELLDMVPEGQKAIQQALLGESEGGDFLDHIFFSEHPLSIESLVKLGLGSIERFLQFIEEGVWAGKLFMETVCKGEKFVWYQNMWDPQHFFLQPFAKWLLPQIPGIPGYVWKGQFPNEKARVDNKESIIASYNIKPEMCPGPTKNMKIVSMITPFPFNLIMDEMREIPQYKPGTFLATFYLSLGDKVDDWPLLMIYALEQQYKTTASRDKGDDEAGTIVEVAQDTPELSTLVAALEAAGLVETLQGEGPFTVFAPTNDAFDALPEGVLEDLLKPENKDTLTEILTYHVVSGAVKASDLEDGQDVETVQGEDVQVTVRDDEGKSKHPRRTIMVNQATVVLEDVMASNGVVHVIDAVLLPPSGVDTDDDTDDDTTDDDTTDDDTTDDDTMDDDAGDDAGDDMAEVLEDIDEALRAVSGGDLGDVEL